MVIPKKGIRDLFKHLDFSVTPPKQTKDREPKTGMKEYVFEVLEASEFGVESWSLSEQSSDPVDSCASRDPSDLDRLSLQISM